MASLLGNIGYDLIKVGLAKSKQTGKNRKECELAASKAELMFGVYSKVKEFEAAMSIAEEYLNKAFINLQDVIDACYKSNIVSGFKNSEKYANDVKNASARLDSAFSLYIFANHAKNIDALRRLYEQSLQMKDAKFEKSDAILDSSGELEDVSSNSNDLKMYSGWTSLHIAAKENSVKKIKELIETRANINLQ